MRLNISAGQLYVRTNNEASMVIGSVLIDEEVNDMNSVVLMQLNLDELKNESNSNINLIFDKKKEIEEINKINNLLINNYPIYSLNVDQMITSPCWNKSLRTDICQVRIIKNIDKDCGYTIFGILNEKLGKDSDFFKIENNKIERCDNFLGQTDGFKLSQLLGKQKWLDKNNKLKYMLSADRSNNIIYDKLHKIYIKSVDFEGYDKLLENINKVPLFSDVNINKEKDYHVFLKNNYDINEFYLESQVKKKYNHFDNYHKGFEKINKDEISEILNNKKSYTNDEYINSLILAYFNYYDDFKDILIEEDNWSDLDPFLKPLVGFNQDLDSYFNFFEENKSPDGFINQILLNFLKQDMRHPTNDHLDEIHKNKMLLEIGGFYDKCILNNIEINPMTKKILFISLFKYGHMNLYNDEDYFNNIGENDIKNDFLSILGSDYLNYEEMLINLDKFLSKQNVSIKKLNTYLNYKFNDKYKTINLEKKVKDSRFLQLLLNNGFELDESLNPENNFFKKLLLDNEEIKNLKFKNKLLKKLDKEINSSDSFKRKI